VTRLFEAEIEPLTTVFGVSRALYALDVLIAALRAAHHTIRPAHLSDVL